MANTDFTPSVPKYKAVRYNGAGTALIPDPITNFENFNAPLALNWTSGVFKDLKVVSVYYKDVVNYSLDANIVGIACALSQKSSSGKYKYGMIEKHPDLLSAMNDDTVAVGIYGTGATAAKDADSSVWKFTISGALVSNGDAFSATFDRKKVVVQNYLVSNTVPTALDTYLETLDGYKTPSA